MHPQGFTAADFGLKLGCEKHWAEMTKEEQRAVVQLGWNSKSWDAGEYHAHNRLLTGETLATSSSPSAYHSSCTNQDACVLFCRH